jgi:hypothetical protein
MRMRTRVLALWIAGAAWLLDGCDVAGNEERALDASRPIGSQVDPSVSPPGSGVVPPGAGVGVSPAVDAGIVGVGPIGVGPVVTDAGAPAATGGGHTGGADAHGPKDHCVDGYDPQPSDETMQEGPAEFYPPGNMNPSIVDLTVQPEVIRWMEDNRWQGAHVEWHAIRGCSLGTGGLSKVNICRFTELVPKDQNCKTGGDGYQFLVFHRHMIMALKQLWPKHTEQFTGFERFPTVAEDLPAQWRAAFKPWSRDELAAGTIGDEIDKPENLARFKDEGELGFWLQCNVSQRLTGAANMPWVGIHFSLHQKWARPGNTRHGVNNTDSNIDNYMFWKLHGWIDNVWERYRRAKGMQPTDKKLQDDLVAQCREMDTEINIIKNNLEPGDPIDPNPPLPVESGYFHEKVRPIFENPKNLCSGCHAEMGANAGMSLAGRISSKQIVAGLVNVASLGGGQYRRVVPGDPDRSWLYLKAAGRAAGAGCMPSSSAQCLTGVMPMSSDGSPTLTAAELQTLRTWIADGAQGPP